MFDKRKLNFWRLAVIFLGFTGITLSALWLSPQESKATMMNESMSNMASMHLENATIYDLVGSSDSETGSSDTSTTTLTTSNDNSQHHTGESSGVKTTAIVTTLIIFILVPLLICGTIILTIVWIE